MNIGHILPSLTVILIYIAIIFTVGVVSHRMTKNLSDYVLGGRSLSAPIAALGAGASDMSSWLIMALPGTVFLHGLNQIWLPMGLIVGAFCNWHFVAKRLRVYTEISGDAHTIPQYLDNRFHKVSKGLHLATASVVLLFFIFYSAAGFVSGAFLTRILFGLTYEHALLISALVIVLYTCIGGFLAISWIDFFQGGFVFLTLLIVPFLIMHHFNGMNQIIAKSTNFINPFNGIGLIGTLSLLAWGLGYFGQPHILVRFMAIKSYRDISTAKWICILWMTLALFGASAIGLLGAFYFHHLSNPETVFLVFARDLFNPWVAGILFAVVLSVIISAVAAQLLSASSALSSDFYRNFIHNKASHREEMIVGRISVILVATIAFWIASDPNSSILKLVAYAWSGIGGSFGPVILISLYWRHMTKEAAIAGLITGASTVVVWHLLGQQFGGVFKLYELLPAFVLNGLAIFITTLLTEKPNISTLEEFDKTKKILAGS